MSESLPAIELEFEGKLHRLDLLEYTGQDDLDLYQKTGVTITDVFGGKITLFTIAGLIWLHRRKTDPSLTFEAVNAKVTPAVQLSIKPGASDEDTSPVKRKGGRS